MLKTLTRENFEPDQLSLFGPGDVAGMTDTDHMENAGLPVRQTTKRATFKSGKCYEVPVEDIQVQFEHTRTADDLDLAPLANSIAEKGLICPILCIATPDASLVLAAGLRRLLAVKELRLPTIKVFIVQGDHLEISLIENLVRDDLTAVQMAEAVKLLKDRNGYTQESVARILGKAPSTISEILSIAELPLEILDKCRTDAFMTREKLLLLCRMKGTLADKIAALEKLQQGTMKPKPTRPGAQRQPVQNVRRLATQLGKMKVDDLKDGERRTLQSELENLISQARQLLAMIDL